MASEHAHGGRPRKKREPVEQSGCAVTELFRLLGKAHMLDILHVFHSDPGVHRFVDLQARLRISPNTLSERLRDLVDAGLLSRTAYNEIPPRVDYEATAKALDLAPLFDSLQTWSGRHDLTPESQERILA